MRNIIGIPGPVLVTGAGGFVGRALVDVLGHMAIPRAHKALDICDRAALERELARTRPMAVINGAAWANVDRCEKDPAGARRANVEGPGTLASVCASQNLPLVHISTDYVFGKEPREVYARDDPTCALNVYGESKAEGERRVLDAWPEAKIARTAWVYGAEGRGFGATMTLRLLKGELVLAINDREGHPTYVRDLARQLVTLLEVDCPGIYHTVNQGPTSWYLFCLRLVRQLGLPSELVRGVSSAELPPAAPRPVRVALETPDLTDIGLPPMRPWQDAQDAFLRDFRSITGSHKAE